MVKQQIQESETALSHCDRDFGRVPSEITRPGISDMNARQALVLSVVLAVLSAFRIATAGDEVNCTGGPFDPPNNGGTNNFPCEVSGIAGAIASVDLQTVINYPFGICANEHTWRLISPLGTIHLIGNIGSGTQNFTGIAAFDGEGATGTWTLRETDSNGFDACNATLTSWRLTIATIAGPVNPSVAFVESVVGEDGGPTIHVRVTTDDMQPTADSGSVDIEVDAKNPGSATAGQDYLIIASTLVVPAGTAHNATLPVVEIIDDAVLERNETIGLLLTNASGLNATGERHQVTIVDDEVGEVSFVNSTSVAFDSDDPIHSVPMQLAVQSDDGPPSIGMFVFGSVANSGGNASQGTYNLACPNQDWSFFERPDNFNASNEFFLNQSTPVYSVQIRICEAGPGPSGKTVILQPNINSPPPNVSFVGGNHTISILRDPFVFGDGFEAVP